MPKTALTDAKLRSLEPAPKGKRVQIMDSIARGLGVRVTDTGAKTFIFQGRFPGSTNSVRREITATTLAALIKQGIDPKEIERKAQEERAQALGHHIRGRSARTISATSWPGSARR